MKKITTTIFGVAIALCSVTLCFSQSDFEGEIVYSIEYGQLPDQPGIENMLPKEMKNSFKGDKTRVDQVLGTSGNSMFIVTDYTDMIGFIAQNMMGQKILIKIDESALKETLETNKNAQVEYKDEYKEILGYKCQKAILTMDNVSSEIYFTDQLPNKANKQFIKLKGMPLEYTIKQQGLEMTLVATSIEKKSIDASIFEKPTGYQEFSMEDLKNMGMGEIKF